IRRRSIAMHYSRLCALLINSHTSDMAAAAAFWANAPGRPVEADHPRHRGNARMLETPPGEPIGESPRVEHAPRSRLTSRLTTSQPRWRALGNRVQGWGTGRRAGFTGQRSCAVRVQRPGFPSTPLGGNEEPFVRFAET